MTDKDFSAKLAAGMRRAKQPGQTETNMTPAAASMTPIPEPAAVDRATPAANPESPWKDLHPKRIWPD